MSEDEDYAEGRYDANNLPYKADSSGNNFVAGFIAVVLLVFLIFLMWLLS